MRWPECVQAVRHRSVPPAAIVPHLASISFPVPDAQPRDVVDVIRYAVSQSLVDDAKLCVDCAMFTTNVLYRQEVDVTAGMASSVCSVLLAFVHRHRDNADVLFHCLRALAALLYDDATACDAYGDQLVSARGVLPELASRHNPNVHVQRLAIQCMGYMCARPPSSRWPDLHTKTKQIILDTLRSPPDGGDKYDMYKLYLACLKALQTCVQAEKRVREESVPDLLASVKAYMLHDIDQTESQQTAVYRAGGARMHRTYDPLQAHMPQLVSLPHNAVREAPVPHRHRDPSLARSAGAEWRSGAGTARQERNQHQHHQHQQHRRRRRNRRDQPQHHQRQRGASDESELSDASPSAIARGKRVFAHQIRVQAIQCAQTIALLCPKKVLFRYWLSFFPESLEETAPSVYNVIARDLIPKVRTAALSLTSCLLQHCRSFLMTAEQSGKALAFTSYAETLSGSLHQLHIALHRACTTEAVPSVRLAAFKCTSALVESTPYHRFKHPDTALLFDIVHTGLRSQDQTTAIAAMKTFAAIVSSTLAEVQLSPLLRVPEAEAPGDKSSVGTDSAHARGSEKQQQSDADDAAHDIMALLLRYGSATQPLASPSASKPPAQSAQSAQSAPASVQVEALQALTALVCRHPRGLTHLWPRLSHLLLQLAGTTAAHAGDDGDDGDDGDGEVASVPKKQQVQPQQVVSSQDEGLNAVVVPRMLKLVEELGRFLQTAPQLQHSAVVFWEAFTESALQECIESDVPFVRSCACDCLASIGSSVFARLQAWKQRHYQVLLLGLSRDQAPPVKAAAGRALGSMVAYPHLQQDAIFMSDMVDALVGAAQDDNITVRVRASWALGNYCNALGALRSLGQLVLNRIVNAEQLHRLLDLSLALCEDKDKIRANALRAVGELARILPTDDRLFFEKCVTAIVNNTHRRPPKVQWNACHAARNVLRNRELKAITPEAVINLVDTLLGTIEHNSNYKVRIGAAGALRSLDRSDWTNQHAFAAALETLLATLTPTGQAKDFNEYRYRETLHKEVALTVHELLLSSPPETLKAASQVLHDQSSQLSIMFGILRREQQMQHGSRPASREAPSADNTSDGARSHDEHQHQHQQARGGDDDGPEQSEGGSGADIAIDVEALEAKLAGIVDVPVHGTRVAMAHEQQKQNGTAMEESETNDED